MPDQLDGQSVLLVGPGWLGAPTARALSSRGARVWTLRRSPFVAERGGEPRAPSAEGPVALQGDIRDPAAASGWGRALPATLDAIVVCLAPSRGAGDTHETTYAASLEAAMRLATSRCCRALVYTSSTGVYGRTDGGISHEDDVIVAADPKQHALLAAEAALRAPQHATTVTRTILRVAGLYGPGRDPAPRFAAVPVDQALDVWCNFSWRDDVVAAIVQRVSDPDPAYEARVFNCADGTPLRTSAIARALGAPDAPSPLRTDNTMMPRRSNQQIHVAPLLATGWRPSMPSVLHGLRALGHGVAGLASEVVP